MAPVPSVKELRVICKRQKASGILLPLCDYLAFYVAKFFLYLPLTPNQITLTWIILKIVSAFFMITGDYTTMVIALLVFQLASIIDGADGTVARYRKRFSLNGIYVDYIGHYFCNSLLFVTLAFGVYHQTENWLSFIAAAIAVVSFLLTKALTLNPMWYGNLEERKEVEKIIYDRDLALLRDQKTGVVRNWKKQIIILLFDFVQMNNPLNLMFWGVFLGYAGEILWIYAGILFLEMSRKLFMQFWRIYRTEKNTLKKSELE